MLTYNREALVGRAIESILCQTMRDFEFIIVDNGSTDRSGVIADEYAAKDSRIQVIHRERGNIGSGRNTGLDAALGEYIAFVDDDDECDPDFLEFLYYLAVNKHADISICGTIKIENEVVSAVSDKDKVMVMDSEEAIVELMWRKLYNTGFPTKLVLAELFKDNRFSETEQYDDIPLFYKILARAKVVVYHGIPKYKVYRHNSNNSSATTKDNLITPKYLEVYRKAYRDRTEWLCKVFPNNIDYWWYFDFSFQISMVNKIITNNLINCETHLKELQIELFEHYDYFMNSIHTLDFEKEWMKKYISILRKTIRHIK
jgi:glycosyltransferase involved in cell wall biosynthesis